MCALQELIAALNDNAKIQTAYSELLSNYESQVNIMSVVILLMDVQRYR